MTDFSDRIKTNAKIQSLIGEISSFNEPFCCDNLETVMLQEDKCFKDESEGKKFWGLFSKLVALFLEPYYRNKLFPSSKYIFDLFFWEIKRIKESASIVISKNILDNIRNSIEINNLLKDTLVIHPLADFGFQDVGDLLFFSKRITNFYFSFSEFIIFPQANNFNQVLKNIRISMRHFKLSNTKLAKELFEHYQRSRNTKWLINNPILIHRITQSYEGYYENQFFITKQLERHLSLLYLFNCISEHNELVKHGLLSTSNTNNFQTYDEYHYFILNYNGEKYEPQCIPRHTKLSNFFDTFKLNIDIPLNFNRNDKRKLLEISRFMDKMYGLLYSSNKNENYYIIRRSLGYFVRSYQAEYNADSVIFLCIAFEMLLGERIVENVSAHIVNIIIFLKDGSEKDIKEFKKLYSSRSGVAHEGEARECDINYCRYLYFEILLIVIRLERKGIDFNDKSYLSNYIKNICTKKLKFIPDIK